MSQAITGILKDSDQNEKPLNSVVTSFIFSSRLSDIHVHVFMNVRTVESFYSWGPMLRDYQILLVRWDLHFVGYWFVAI